MIRKNGAFKIHGTVTQKESREGLPNLTIRALDKDFFCDDLLGEAITDKKGYFEITYDKEDFQERYCDQKPDIYLRIFSPEGEEILTTEDKVRYNAGYTEAFSIVIPESVYKPKPWTLQVTLLRPEDMLALDFKFHNLRISSGNLVHEKHDRPAYMAVGFPPQNIAEEAFYEQAEEFPEEDDGDDVTRAVTIDDTDTDNDNDNDNETEHPHVPVQTRLAGPSRLVFIVPKGMEIPFTGRGLLEACGKLQLKVAPTAKPPINFLSDIQPIRVERLFQGTFSHTVGEKRKKVPVSLKKRRYKSYNNYFQREISKDYIDSSMKRPLEPRPPNDLETAIEAPYRLIISPNKHAAWAHALDPVKSGKSKHVEIWHTRQAVRVRDLLFDWNRVPGDDDEILLDNLMNWLGIDWLKGAVIEKNGDENKISIAKGDNRLTFTLNPEKNRVRLYIDGLETEEYIAEEEDGALNVYSAAVREDEERLRTIRAIWTRDYSLLNEDSHAYNSPLAFDNQSDTGFLNLFRMSLNAYDRHNIVQLSANYNVPSLDPLPINVTHLMLTSFGGWLNVRGAWDPTMESKLSVEEWRHRATMGRDHYVRVVYKGYLFPFGHRASLVKVTERKFHPTLMLMLSNLRRRLEVEMKNRIESFKTATQKDMAFVADSLALHFDHMMTELTASMAGKSQRQILREAEARKKEFRQTAVAVVGSAGKNVTKEAIELVDTVQNEFQHSADIVSEVIKGMSYQNISGNIAYLRQRNFIVVREPERLYIDSGVANDAGHSYDRQMPFAAVKVTTLATPSLDAPAVADSYNSYSFDIGDKQYDTGQFLFWPRVGGNNFQFHMEAEDFSGNTVEFSTPLLYVGQAFLSEMYTGGGIEPPPDYYEDIKSALEEVREDYESKVKAMMNGQAVMYADYVNDPGETTFETQSVTFSAQIPESYDVYTTLRNNLDDRDFPCFYPKVHRAEVLIPSIKHLVGNHQTAEIEYFSDYLSNGFESGNPGQVFAKMTDSGIALDFDSQGDRSGGLVKPNLQITALSRIMGPVGGNPVTIGNEGFEPADFFSGLDAKIFGVISLSSIIKSVGLSSIPTTPQQGIKLSIPSLFSDISKDKIEVKFAWKPELKDWNNIFLTTGNSSLTITATITAHASGKAETDISCVMENFSINLIGNLESFIILEFAEIKFALQAGKKPDINVDISKIKFVGVLAFVETLKEYIPLNGFSDPPSLDISAEGIRAGYTLNLPDFPIGVVAVKNISLGASFALPFNSDPLSVRFSFCDRHSPFLVTYCMIGGGGFFAITVTPNGVKMLEASIELAADISVDFSVAKGGVHVGVGIYFKMEMNPDNASLTGYFQLRGVVEVLGIISANSILRLPTISKQAN